MGATLNQIGVTIDEQEGDRLVFIELEDDEVTMFPQLGKTRLLNSYNVFSKGNRLAVNPETKKWFIVFKFEFDEFIREATGPD